MKSKYVLLSTMVINTYSILQTPFNNIVISSTITKTLSVLSTSVGSRESSIKKSKPLGLNLQSFIDFCFLIT